MSENYPLVSVAMLTYGHEKYIRQALDSIMAQKVNFEYEVVVGEDCSPDRTREILKEFEQKYPDKFVMIYRDQNVGAYENEEDVLRRCRGKYIAFLEGDDYWTSDQKLQKQIDYLEAHENCIATAHRIEVVDEEGNQTAEKYPECHDRIYTFRHFKRGLLPSQSASIVSRNIYNDPRFDADIINDEEMVPGDRVTVFVLAAYGEIHCFPETMSAYRHVTTGGSSYSATKDKRTDPLRKIYFYRALMEYAKKIDVNREAVKAAESLYLFVVVRGLGKRGIDFGVIRTALTEIEHKSTAVGFAVYQMLSWPVRRLILKQEGRI